MERLTAFAYTLKLSAEQQKDYTFVTDGEVALINALQLLFPFAKFILCYNHCKQNILDKLRSIIKKHNLQQETFDMVKCTISGVGTARGIMDYKSTELTEVVLEQFRKIWYVSFIKY